MSSLMACIAGMALDAIFGDPVWLYHPVRIIGNWISILEKWLRGFCKNDEKKERIAGCVLWFGVVIASVGIPWGLLYLAGKVSFWLQFALETFWCYQLLAGKCLKDESRKVYVRLVNHNLEGARHAVSMIFQSTQLHTVRCPCFLDVHRDVKLILEMFSICIQDCLRDQAV